MMSYLYVALGGGLGAAGRFGLSQLMGRANFAGVPLATLCANIIGSLLMGILAAWLFARGDNDPHLFLGVGLLGGFTTFSAFSLEAFALWENGQTGAALAYILASVLLSIAALTAGFLLSRQMFS